MHDRAGHEALAELFAQPREVTSVVTTRCSPRFELEREDSAVLDFDDEVDLVSTVSRGRRRARRRDGDRAISGRSCALA